jgi:hypothetical protein
MKTASATIHKRYEFEKEGMGKGEKRRKGEAYLYG